MCSILCLHRWASGMSWWFLQPVWRSTAQQWRTSWTTTGTSWNVDTIDRYCCKLDTLTLHTLSFLCCQWLFLCFCFFCQHCTLDLGSYIKDLSVVHDDLSSIVILDNSPGAYRSHPGKIQRWKRHVFKYRNCCSASKRLHDAPGLPLSVLSQ